MGAAIIYVVSPFFSRTRSTSSQSPYAEMCVICVSSSNLTMAIKINKNKTFALKGQRWTMAKGQYVLAPYCITFTLTNQEKCKYTVHFGSHGRLHTPVTYMHGVHARFLMLRTQVVSMMIFGLD